LLDMLAKKQDARPTTEQVVARLEIVGAELRRRRDSACGISAASLRAPTEEPGVMAPRRAVDVGLADTRLARKPRRHWHYAAAAIALAANISLLVVSRDGDATAASAATAPKPTAVVPAPAVSETSQPVPVDELAISEPGGFDVGEPATVAPVAP